MPFSLKKNANQKIKERIPIDTNRLARKCSQKGNKNKFVDVVSLSNYRRERTRRERKKCKCQYFRKKERCCILCELTLASNSLTNLHGFACRCSKCEKAKHTDEALEKRPETSGRRPDDVDKLIS